MCGSDLDQLCVSDRVCVCVCMCGPDRDQRCTSRLDQRAGQHTRSSYFHQTVISGNTPAPPTVMVGEHTSCSSCFYPTTHHLCSCCFIGLLLLLLLVNTPGSFTAFQLVGQTTASACVCARTPRDQIIASEVPMCTSCRGTISRAKCQPLRCQGTNKCRFCISTLFCLCAICCAQAHRFVFACVCRL